MFGNASHIVGNIVRDPELRFAQSGTAIVTFTVCWNRRRNDQDDEAHFFDVIAFRTLAENIAGSLRKGDRVAVVGQLDQNRWTTDDGQNRSRVQIIADDVAASLRWAEVSINKNEKRGDSGGYRQQSQSSPQQQRQPQGSAPAGEDDEPF